MLFTEITFTGLGVSPDPYEFIPNTRQRVRTFSPSVQMRGENRPQMQMHGRHPVTYYADALQIHHEGLIVGDDADDILEERALMLATIIGDLSAAPVGTTLGTLTVKMAQWSQTATAEVALEAWEADLRYERLRSAPYLFSWIVFTPYFIGDSTPTVYYL